MSLFIFLTVVGVLALVSLPGSLLERLVHCVCARRHLKAVPFAPEPQFEVLCVQGSGRIVKIFYPDESLIEVEFIDIDGYVLSCETCFSIEEAYDVLMKGPINF